MTELMDIVERLRNFEGSDALGDGDFSICCNAATEIEALRARCAAMKAALRRIERLCVSQTGILMRLNNAATLDTVRAALGAAK
jgi:hypothetical protein